MTRNPSRLRIAVVGAGIAGLSAAHFLSKKHEVVLFESDPQLGGHAHSETITAKNGKTFEVDTAFLVFNERTYPQFMQFLKELQVDQFAIPAEMSSCFSDPSQNFDYTLGAGLTPFLSTPKVLLQKKFWQIISDLIRFRKQAVKDIDNKVDLSSVTAEEYLKTYSPAFVQNFIWPLTSAIWSLADGNMKHYPIATLLEYFDNHQLLRGNSDKKWRTFLGSSLVYIKAFQNQFTGEIRLKTPVLSISRTETHMMVKTAAYIESFDNVVLATHADVAKKLIAEPNELEIQLLAPWKYKNNPVTLHQDRTILSKNTEMWGSWNMLKQADAYQISYYLNRLQKLPTNDPVILSLGEIKVDTQKILKTFNYRHPVFTQSSVATQPRLKELNGKDRIFFCGSYFGYGFHEDAIKSAAEVAKWFQTNQKE